MHPHGDPEALLAATSQAEPARCVVFDPTKPHGLDAALRTYAPDMGVAVLDWDTRGTAPWARLIILEPPSDPGAES